MVPFFSHKKLKVIINNLYKTTNMKTSFEKQYKHFELTIELFPIIGGGIGYNDKTLVAFIPGIGIMIDFSSKAKPKNQKK